MNIFGLMFTQKDADKLANVPKACGSSHHRHKWGEHIHNVDKRQMGGQIKENGRPRNKLIEDMFQYIRECPCGVRQARHPALGWIPLSSSTYGKTPIERSV